MAWALFQSVAGGPGGVRGHVANDGKINNQCWLLIGFRFKINNFDWIIFIKSIFIGSIRN